jgi:cell division protein FtsI/penicillin-binding protein 2
VALALALLAACTPGSSPHDPLERLEPDVVAFEEAWANQEAAVMSAYVPSTSQWTSFRIQEVFDRVLSESGSESFEITTGRFSPDDLSADVPYTITYDSVAADTPVTFEGTFQLTYSDEQARWVADWDPSWMFPGEPRAKHFRIVTTYPRRAALLDRHGRKLAVGPAAERRYPFGSAAGATIGHIEPIKKKDIRDGMPLQPGDLVGGSGLEKAFDAQLAGTPDTKVQIIDAKGKVLDTVGRGDGDPSHFVKTTLDIRVQQAAERAYGSTTGGAVVLDPQTGDILAAVASSPFNPANYVGVSGIEPFNRALSGLYPPGSSMKVMTASTALELGEVKTTTQLTGPAEYKGVRNFESGEFGTLSFASALQNSVNTAFAQVAEKIGADRLKKSADLFGFNRIPSMPLEAARSSFPFPEDEGDLLWGAIGQAQTLATPLQMASVAATVANDGKRMEPRISLSEEPHGERVISAKTAQIMTTLMESVVQGGTGVAAQISGVRVAGKTGTAEVDVGGERKNHAWFICFAPANDPKVAIAVVSEYGGVGGQVAAPLARSILTSVLPLL